MEQQNQSPVGQAMAPVSGQDGAMVALSENEVLAQVQKIQWLLKAVMKEGTHYGTPPGCPKPMLYKPGCEKILLTFQITPRIDERNVYDLGNGHKEYEFVIGLYSRNGKLLGQGIGSCSTMEGKYRYRSENTGELVPKEYWDRGKDQSVIGGPGFVARKRSIRGSDGKEVSRWFVFHEVETTNPADNYNTCKKMAKKRAVSDAVLSVTGCSDIFVQEDIGDEEREDRPAKPPQDYGSEEGEGQGKTPGPGLATEKQLKMIGALEKKLKLEKELITNMLKEDFKVDSHKKLTKQQASDLITRFKEAEKNLGSGEDDAPPPEEE